MTGSRGLSPHSAFSPFPLETGTCTLDSVVECCKPIAYSHILAISIFQVKIWSSSGSSRKTIAAPEWASASILTQTPVRGGALVLLGIFDPADGSNVPHRTPQLWPRAEMNIAVRVLPFQAIQARLSHPFPRAP